MFEGMKSFVKKRRWNLQQSISCLFYANYDISYYTNRDIFVFFLSYNRNLRNW